MLGQNKCSKNNRIKQTLVSGVAPMKRKEVEGKIIILVARNHALDSSCSGFLVDSRLTLTDSFTTDIALEGTALANRPLDQEAVISG